MPSAPREAEVLVVAGCTDAGSLDRVQDALDPWRRDARVPPRDLLLFETAVVEVLGNVVRNGAGAPGFFATVTLRLVPGERLEAVVEDCGPAADLELAAGLTFPEAESEHGRGLPLARAVLDELTYTPGNRWRLVRGLP